MLLIRGVYRRPRNGSEESACRYDACFLLELDQSIVAAGVEGDCVRETESTRCGIGVEDRVSGRRDLDDVRIILVSHKQIALAVESYSSGAAQCRVRKEGRCEKYEGEENVIMKALPAAHLGKMRL